MLIKTKRRTSEEDEQRRKDFGLCLVSAAIKKRENVLRCEGVERLLKSQTACCSNPRPPARSPDLWFLTALARSDRQIACWPTPARVGSSAPRPV